MRMPVALFSRAGGEGSGPASNCSGLESVQPLPPTDTIVFISLPPQRAESGLNELSVGRSLYLRSVGGAQKMLKKR